VSELLTNVIIPLVKLIEKTQLIVFTFRVKHFTLF